MEALAALGRVLRASMKVAGIFMILVGLAWIILGEIARGLIDVGIGLFAYYWLSRKTENEL